MIEIEPLLTDFEKWLRGPNFANPYAEKTILTYLANIRRFLVKLDSEGVEHLEEVSIAMLRKFVRTGVNGNGSSKSSAHVKMSALMLYYDWMASNGIVQDDLGMDLRREYQERKQRRFGGHGGFEKKRLIPVLSRQEIETLLATADRGTSYSAMRDKTILRVLLDTGLRASELVALQVQDAQNYLDGKIQIVGKGNRERIVRFPVHGREALRAWMQIRHRSRPRDETLFITDQGKAIPPKDLHTVVSRWLSRAGIRKPQMGPHLLRHTAASLWLAEGMNLRLVQENLGHGSIAATGRYLHVLND